MSERCSHCGQIIPPQFLFEHQPVKQRIYDFIAAHPEGVTRDQLMASVYADRIDGGPEWPVVISVHLNEMRPVLERKGLTITSMRGPGSKYRLTALAEGGAP